MQEKVVDKIDRVKRQRVEMKLRPKVAGTMLGAGGFQLLQCFRDK